VASETPGPAADEAPRGVLKSPQAFGAGVFLLGFALIAFAGASGWFPGGSDLKFGQLRGIGPGLMPKVMAAMLGAFGLLLIVQSFITRGDVLERWAIRGPLFVLGAVLLFAATIRGVEFFGVKFPALGLAVSGPLAVIFSGLADKDTRWGELIIYAVVITTLCAGLFKFALRLPIPLAPWLLGY
jgi:Tripartite tricarboxylate transporter TctB family